MPGLHTGFLLFPGLLQMDFTGPYGVFAAAPAGGGGRQPHHRRRGQRGHRHGPDPGRHDLERGGRGSHRIEYGIHPGTPLWQRHTGDGPSKGGATPAHGKCRPTADPPASCQNRGGKVVTPWGGRFSRGRGKTPSAQTADTRRIRPPCRAGGSSFCFRRSRLFTSPAAASPPSRPCSFDCKSGQKKVAFYHTR